MQSPHCVDDVKWSVLKDPDIDPEDLARSVVDIWDKLHTQMLALGYAIFAEFFRP